MQLEFGGLLFTKTSGGALGENPRDSTEVHYVCMRDSKVIMTCSVSQHHSSTPSIFRLLSAKHCELTTFLNPSVKRLWTSPDSGVAVLRTQKVGICCLPKPQRFVDLVAVLTGTQTHVSRVWRGQEFCFSSQNQRQRLLPLWLSDSFFPWNTPHTGEKKAEPQ